MRFVLDELLFGSNTGTNFAIICDLYVWFTRMGMHIVFDG